MKKRYLRIFVLSLFCSLGCNISAQSTTNERTTNQSITAEPTYLEKIDKSKKEIIQITMDLKAIGIEVNSDDAINSVDLEFVNKRLEELRLLKKEKSSNYNFK